MLTGYLHPNYAASLSEFGTPIKLDDSGGWLLKRAVDGSASHDAMGCYPLFCCANWRGLRQDIEAVREELVSIVVVADPLGEHTPELLATCFEFVVPFKEHFVIETGNPIESFIKKSHRRHALHALREVRVELCPEPLMHIDEWERLYNILSARHAIKGLRRFSRATFEKQLAIPGMVMFRAVAERQTVSLDLWYQQDDCANWHLAASSDAGYKLLAAYAIKWRAIEYFNDKVRWINLGAGTTSGSSSDHSSGLSYFKSGWSTGTKRAWLCGSVLQPDKYAALVRLHTPKQAVYFPAYRAGEFA